MASNTPNISTELGRALDRLFLQEHRPASFSKLKATGTHLRRFFRETENTQREIAFYRDKWWTASGGTLYAELYCLVPELQLAVHGEAQSLLTPDYRIPFSHFQYVLSEPQSKRSWALSSIEDVIAFEQEMKEWLPSVALPWLEQFDSRAGVIQHLQSRRQLVTLAEYLAYLGDRHAAWQTVRAWVEGLPRQTGRTLHKLAGKGLISQADQAYLEKASIQSEEDYRRQVAGWLSAVRSE